MDTLFYRQNKESSGFTLIEILVVISIIGVLASVALASMQESRIAAKQAVVIEQARQMLLIAELGYRDTGDYADVNHSLILACTEFDSGNYIDENRRMCQRIIDNGGVLYSGAALDVSDGCCEIEPIINQHSILVRLPGTVNEYFCISSNGGVYRGIIGTNPDPEAINGLNDPVYDANSHPKGCPFNP